MHFNVCASNSFSLNIVVFLLDFMHSSCLGVMASFAYIYYTFAFEAQYKIRQLKIRLC